MRTFHSVLLGLLGCAVAAPIAAQASPNLLANGSFEASPTAITSWAVSNPPYGSGPGKGPELITTDGKTVGPYGDRVSADPFTFSPDGAGTQAVYLVDDNAHETLSQTIKLTAGATYQVGFDLFKTASGSRNPGDFSLAATFDGVSLADATSSSLQTGTWTHYSGTVTQAANRTGQFLFTYDSAPGISKDVLIDEVYVTKVPEPPAMAMFLSGVAMLGGVAFSRRRATRS